MLNPEVLKHYREEENLLEDTAAKKIGVLPSTLRKWESGEEFPSYAQLRKMADKYKVCLGFLTLDNPVEYTLPIADFRTSKGKTPIKPSKELIQSIYDAQFKQDWFREIKISEDIQPVIKKKNLALKDIGKQIRKDIGIAELQDKSKNKKDFLNNLISVLDTKGFLIIKNGILGTNTHRPLSKEEFKGFAIFDEMAPLIFINGKDFVSSQIFTIAHELAHLYLGESGVDGDATFKNTEQLCNRIAGEVLLPNENFLFKEGEEEAIAEKFKISVFVVLVKAKQLQKINQTYFEDKLKSFGEEVISQKNDNPGGDFYNNVRFRAGGNNFLKTVIKYTLAGKTLYRDAYRLTGLKAKSFDTYYKKKGYL